MAAPTNTYQTYQSIGNREDLIDVIENIDPVDTFVTSNTGSGRATATFHEWQTDALAAAGANKAIEGNDAAAVAITPTLRPGNYCQILTKSWQISDTQEAIDTAGRSSEIGYQTAKHLKELARDIEYALLINASSAAGASGTARQLKGIIGWISTTNTTGAGTADEALTETMLNDNLSAVWALGGFPSALLVGSFQKRKISNFSTNTRNVTASQKELTRAVDVYESDFGTVTVRLHHQLNTTAPGTLVTLGEMRLWKKAWLRPVKRRELALTGDSRKFLLTAELTLESLQEKGSGKITLLTTS
jgi:hypothetical protein